MARSIPRDLSRKSGQKVQTTNPSGARENVTVPTIAIAIASVIVA